VKQTRELNKKKTPVDKDYLEKYSIFI